MDVDGFIRVWSAAGLSERSLYQGFINQLCRLIEVPEPYAAQADDPDYCFKRRVQFVHDDGSDHPGYIDCYRQGCFVLEAKQSRKRMSGGDLDPQPQIDLLRGRRSRPSGPTPSAIDRLLRSAKRQAENYAKALPEWPPFLVVVDVGRSIELWADFARQGKAYVPFPDRARYRIGLEDLRDPEVRDRLRRVWTDPMSLDPSTRVAVVTTDIATRLAWLVRSIGSRAPTRPDGRLDPVDRAAWANKTAMFVMQCIFAMFADSVGLIEDRGFRTLLESYRGKAHQFHKAAGEFFRQMDRGGHCSAIRQDIRRFNGGLFREAAALPIDEAELEALIAAAQRDWASVEPAIFGALLEQALDPDLRAELGAHYTPRAWVEMLVEPTVLEVLRADWQGVEAAAIAQYEAGDARAARRLISQFHRELCRVRVLDPACGTGNFLYVTMGMMKELEGEVLSALADMGEVQAALDLDGHTVSPAQFYGLEKNAYAAWIAEMVMWIGYLQWHFRLFGDAKPSEPILRSYGRIQHVDALMRWTRNELVRDAAGRPTLRWRPMRRDKTPFTPQDDTREIERIVDPRSTPWPDVHFIVGNPPFMGAKDMRRNLGDGYVDALWLLNEGRFRSADMVTLWWRRAADILTRPGSTLRRFGFITTNSVTQTFSRRAIEHHLSGTPPMRLIFAVPDHPWARGHGAADVRVAMTVAERGEPDGGARLVTVDCEIPGEALRYAERSGVISAALAIGDSDSALHPLAANAGLCSPGVKLHGSGFIVTGEQAAALDAQSDPSVASPIRPYRNGRDLAGRSRDVKVIDLYGWDETEARRLVPGIYDHLLQTVRPERMRNNRPAYRDAWWMFGEPRSALRPALEGLERYIATPETARHRWFTFLDATITPDNMVIVVASDDAAILGILSSRIHTVWAAARGGRMGVGNDLRYTKGACFDAFPFPSTGPRTAAVAELAEDLKLARDRTLARGWTMTEIYNARARWKAGGSLDARELEAHRSGLIALIDDLHRQIDEQTAAAYGWAADLSDVEVMARLTALNLERRREEQAGHVRFLRPGFQAGRAPPSVAAVQIEAPLAPVIARPRLPESPGPLAHALLSALLRERRPVGPRALAARFADGAGRRTEDRIEQTLAILAVAGSVQRTDRGWFAPRRLD